MLDAYHITAHALATQKSGTVHQSTSFAFGCVLDKRLEASWYTWDTIGNYKHYGGGNNYNADYTHFKLLGTPTQGTKYSKANWVVI